MRYAAVAATVVVCLIAGAAIQAAAWAQDDEAAQHIETILRGLENRAQRVRSLSAYVTEETYHNPMADAEWAGWRSLWQYFWAHTPTHIRHDTCEVVARGQEVTPRVAQTSTYDGQRAVGMAVGSFTARVSETLTPEGRQGYGLMPGWLGVSVPVIDFKPHAELRQMGPDLQLEPDATIRDTLCKVLRWQGDERTLRWWIAPDLGFLTLKKETLVDKPARPLVTRWVWAVEEMTQCEPGLWMPLRIRELGMTHPKGETAWSWGRAKMIQVTGLQVNKDLPAHLFGLVLPLGTRVYRPDQDTPVSIIGGDIQAVIERTVEGRAPSGLLEIPD